jgi:hypothetical protein
MVQVTLNRALQGDSRAIDTILAFADRTGRFDPAPASGEVPGVILVPERCASYEEWEEKHGADARRVHDFSSDKKSAPRPQISTLEAGDELFAEGDLVGAFGTYRRHMLLCKRPLETCSTDEQRQRLYDVVARMARIAVALLLNGQFQDALNVSVIASGAMPQEPWVYSMRLYALMLLDRVDEAKQIFDQFRGQMWTSVVMDDGSHKLPWEAGVVEGFVMLRSANFTHPLMDEIQELIEPPDATEVPLAPESLDDSMATRL